MQIIENPEQIRMRYVPVRAFIIGGALVIVTGGLFLWTLFPILGAGISSGFWQLVVAAVFGAVFLLMIVSLARTAIVTVTLSRSLRSVETRFGRIFGSRTNRYHFTQVKTFKSYRDADSSRYYLDLVLENNDKIALKIGVGKDKNERTRLVKKLNKFVKSNRAPGEFV